MKLNQAVAIRVRELLKERKMTQYRLEKNSGISHNTMISLMNLKYSSVNLKTVVAIICGFGMTVSEFFNHSIFEISDLEF